MTGFKGRSGRSFRARLALMQTEEGQWRVEFDEPWAREGAKPPEGEEAGSSGRGSRLGRGRLNHGEQRLDGRPGGVGRPRGGEDRAAHRALGDRVHGDAAVEGERQLGTEPTSRLPNDVPVDDAAVGVD